MTKHYLRRFSLMVALLLGISIGYSQTVVSGTVKGKSGETLPGVNIKVSQTVTGTTTNSDGQFSINIQQSPPIKLEFSTIGYKTLVQEITAASTTDLAIIMEEDVTQLSEILVSGRTSELAISSSRSVEKMNILDIRNTPAPTFYDAISNMKGVDMSTQSLTFRSINMRGFGANGNTRVVQLIDGMDNQAPGLNFAVGNVVGISDLDLESLEILPGAASALYGPNAINGLLLMNSKNPFEYQGLSAYVKTGFMHESNRTNPTTPFYDAAIRYAKSFNNKLAIKLNVSYLTADDWQARDTRDQSLLNGSSLETGARYNNRAYNGVNIYGDETNVNMYTGLYANGVPGNGTGGTSSALGAIATTLIGPFTLPTWTGKTPQQLFAQLMPASNYSSISRKGYAETDLVDYNTESLKINAALHYRIGSKMEAILQGNYGAGTSVYTGADRYSLKNFSLYQIKAELKGDNFFIRGYTTQERSGDAYAAGTLGQLVNEAWKPSTTWYPQYFGTYFTRAFQTYAGTFGALVGSVGPAAAESAAMAAAQAGISGFHQDAREVADVGRLLPGSTEWDATLKTLKKTAIPNGARFVDKTNLFHAEGMYNFKNVINFAEIIVGGNYRVYDLNSNKTIFAVDGDGNEYNITEFGGYAQIAKALVNDKLKVTASVRYDKNQNFDGQTTPRFSAVYQFAKNQYLRASYQTGFRIPTCQDQYINLKTPQARLLGGLKQFQDEYNLDGNVTDPATGQPYTFKEFEPERVKSYEVGYKGVIDNLTFDAYYYYNDFVNFIGGQVLLGPSDGTPADDLRGYTIYSLPVNISNSIKSQGWALGLNYAVPNSKYNLNGNLAFNELLNSNDLPAGFNPQYNTPRYRYNISMSNREVTKTFGFNVTWRWQDEYVWQSSFVGPNARLYNKSVIPAYGTLDAQVSFKMPKAKSTLKIGGTNLLQEAYTSSWGNPTVGGLYYIQINFDEMFR